MHPFPVLTAVEAVSLQHEPDPLPSPGCISLLSYSFSGSSMSGVSFHQPWPAAVTGKAEMVQSLLPFHQETPEPPKPTWDPINSQKHSPAGTSMLQVSSLNTPRGSFSSQTRHSMLTTAPTHLLALAAHCSPWQVRQQLASGAGQEHWGAKAPFSRVRDLGHCC